MRLATVRAPRIRDLGSRQVERVLSRNQVGRIAFVDDTHVELQPVNYVYMDGAIYGRTSFGSKYLAWLHNPFVAFEVDEIDGPLDWRSVIVHGTVYVLHPTASQAEEADFRKAVEHLRAAFPDAFTDQDRTPSRIVIFRVEPHEVTGREARSV
jgi:hypothetical protein